MTNYSSILMLLVVITSTDGANLPQLEPDEAIIQHYNSIATDPHTSQRIRLSNANKLLQLKKPDLAALTYRDILTSNRDDLNLDLKLLAVDGLAKCGDAFRASAILTLMAIVSQPAATAKQKEKALSIFKSWKITIQ